MSKPKKDDSLDFKESTRKNIYKRAGALCTIKDCLAPTFSDDGNLEIMGPVQKATTTGKACHIYSASEDGPRGHGNKEPEFIRSTNNGFWACGTCHDNVDRVSSMYSAETLFEMKMVRETAQSIARHHPVVRSLVGRAGMQWLDDLVWASPDRTDRDTIAVAYVSIAEKIAIFAREIVAPVSSILSAAPRAMTPLVTSISNATELLTLTPLSKQGQSRLILPVLSNANMRERAYVLADSWCGGHTNKIVQSVVRGHLMTISSATGQESEVVSIETDTDALRFSSAERGKEFAVAQLVILGFRKSVPWLGLTLLVRVENDGAVTSSHSLKVKGFPCPDSTRDRGWIPRLRQVSSLLKRALAGESLFIGLAIQPRQDVPDDSSPAMHPDPFEIQLGKSRADIEVAVQRIERTLTCFKLAQEFRLKIIFSEGPKDKNSWDKRLLGAFCVQLSDDAMRSGIEQVLSLPSPEFGSKTGVWSEPLAEYSDAGRDYVVKAHLYNGHISFISKRTLPR